MACWYALDQGHEVGYLLNMMYSGPRRVSFHGTRGHMIARQAEAMGITLAQFTVPLDLAQYETHFKRALSVLKRRGVTGVVFGDIYLEGHREWVERVCADMGLAAILPLWGRETGDLLDAFVEAGFEAVVVAANARFFTEEWLGRRIDRQFVADLGTLAARGEIDICGERGEYHSLVVDGPLFQRRMAVTLGTRTQRDGYWLLDIPRCRLEAK